MWVVKLGGSLAHTQELVSWLEVAARCGRGRVALVAGGGGFADQVRSAQDRWRFGDRAAHHMALLAMEQYALMLQDLRPGLVAVRTGEETLAALENADTPLWLPSRMVLDAPDVAPSWDVTSDSLAAWFAQKLGASHLVLVKSFPLKQPSMSAHSLREAGIVDRAFADYVKSNGLATRVLGRTDYDLFEKALGEGTLSGTSVSAD